MTKATIIHGDCLEELKRLDDNSIDAVITDPPYGLSNTKPAQVADVLKAWVAGDTETVPTKRGGFMGKDWDSFVPPPAVWEECMRVLKPGGHMAVFAGARTQDLMGLSIRLAGFEIRDTLGWIYGSGFPKSHNISKAIDKDAGAEREVVGTYAGASNIGKKADGKWGYEPGQGSNAGADLSVPITVPATDAAKHWDGWGTALKPAIEPIILARKPLDGTVANNVLEHGVGGLNIDACRIATDDDLGAAGRGAQTFSNQVFGGGLGVSSGRSNAAGGRFPANVLLDEHAAAEMDAQSGVSTSSVRESEDKDDPGATFSIVRALTGVTARGHNDSGGASRYFPIFKYQPKAPKRERPIIEREDGTKIQHPTVKPVALMEWLVSLIVPPGGVALDPFAGSGTTLQAAINKGFTPIGIEQDADYIQLIEKRLGQ